jgi:ABC-type transport system involved in cytochrome c biogenesis permease subunit
MMGFQQAAAAIYLAAGIGALLGLVLPSPRLSRGAVWAVGLGAVVQAAAFATLHEQQPVPQLTDLPYAISFMAWVGVISLLVLMWRLRLAELTAAVGPLAFLGAFLPSLGGLSEAGAGVLPTGGTVPHAHVLLSSAGLGLLGISGLAGIFYLLEHRRLKMKRLGSGRIRLPSLEALDRVNVSALVIGFPLLTLGLITGSAWLYATTGKLWVGSPHAIWTLAGWGIYGAMSLVRFAGRQGARHAAASAVAGFAFLLFAVVGVEILR